MRMTTGAEVLDWPKVSLATAVNEYTRGSVGRNAKVIELVDASASLEAPTNNARFVTVLPVDVAVAVRMMSVPNCSEEFVVEAASRTGI